MLILSAPTIDCIQRRAVLGYSFFTSTFPTVIRKSSPSSLYSKCSGESVMLSWMIPISTLVPSTLSLLPQGTEAMWRTAYKPV